MQASRWLTAAAAGDGADVALLDRAGPQAVRAEPDQRRPVALFAGGMLSRRSSGKRTRSGRGLDAHLP